MTVMKKKTEAKHRRLMQLLHLLLSVNFCLFGALGVSPWPLRSLFSGKAWVGLDHLWIVVVSSNQSQLGSCCVYNIQIHVLGVAGLLHDGPMVQRLGLVVAAVLLSLEVRLWGSQDQQICVVNVAKHVGSICVQVLQRSFNRVLQLEDLH